MKERKNLIGKKEEWKLCPLWDGFFNEMKKMGKFKQALNMSCVFVINIVYQLVLKLQIFAYRLLVVIM